MRTRRGLRQVDLAQALGVAQTTIANYEKKLRFPDEQMLGRLADFFRVSMDFLLGRSAAESEAGSRGRNDGEAPAALGRDARRYLDLLRANRADQALALVEAAVAGGVAAAGNVAAAGGAALGEVYLKILEPALRETGRLWERGELQVGEEHAISLATQRIMSRIFVSPALRRRDPAAPSAMVLAVSGEHHLIGPTMVCDLLRADGWRVMFPGDNLSVRHTLELLQQSAPQLVALSVTIAEHVAAADDLVSAIRGHAGTRAPLIMVGGQAFQGRPQLWQEIGADGTAADAAQAVLVANRLVTRRT